MVPKKNIYILCYRLYNNYANSSLEGNQCVTFRGYFFKKLLSARLKIFNVSLLFCFFLKKTGIRQEQILYVRLIDAVTKQVSTLSNYQLINRR